MAWTFEVVEKHRDGFVIVASLKFSNGKDEVTESFRNAESDDAIAEHARLQIAELERGDAILSGLTVGTKIVPTKPPAIDPKAQELAEANAALMISVSKAQQRKYLAELNDPDVDAALSRVTAAEADLKG